MTDSDPFTAYCHSREDRFKPGAMCHGPDNTILASNWFGREEVLVYDVTSTQFTVKDRIPVNVEQPLHVHYMETVQHGGIVVVATFLPLNKGHMSAYGLVSKKLVWKIEDKKIDGKVLKPRGMCSDPDTRVLYVGDWENKRLIVLEPNTGEVIQSIQLPGVGKIWGIAWCSVQPHLVIKHRKDIRYYNIN